MCKTKLLSDMPAESDAFDSHERLAKTIATVIQEEEGGKAIALTGSWGSGKSTVIKFLKSKLVESPQGSSSPIAVFVFDAWSHQGDPLRRSFLESLIRFLSNIKWTNEAAWKGDIDRITCRIEESQTTSEPMLTPAGKAFAVSAILVTVGLALFDKVELNYSVAYVPWSVIRILLIFSPLLVGLVTWISWRPSAKIWQKKFWIEHRSPHQKDKIANLFVEKSRQVNESRTIKTPDPTAIEFNEIFARILQSILPGNKRKLVVVIDNLDRVDPEEALKIWATMRIFFDMDDLHKDEISKRFWLIVPFDPSALQRLWGETTNGSKELVKAFVNKTYQLSFRVAPPVFSDWKSFFHQELKIAFPEHKPEDFDTIYNLYRLKGISAERPVTPREIKIFINAVGTLHRQWCGTISLPLQALYVLYMDQIQDPREDIAKEDFLDPRIRSLLDEPEWRKFLAALHFNVKPEKALQVLIGRRIEEALSTGNGTEMKDIHSVPGFIDVCDQVIQESYDEWSTSIPSSLAQAASVIKEIQGEEKAKWKQTWKRLVKGAEKVVIWKLLDKKVGSGIVSLVENCPAGGLRLTGTILASLSNTQPVSVTKTTTGESSSIPDPTDITSWLDGLLEVFDGLEKLGHKGLITEQFRVSATASLYVQIIIQISKRKFPDEKAIYFKTNLRSTEIVGELSSLVKRDNFLYSHSEIINYLGKLLPQWDWTDLVVNLTYKLQASSTVQPISIAGLINAMSILADRSDCPEAKTNLQDLVNKGHLLHHLQIVHQSNIPDSEAVCLFPILEINPEGQHQTNVGQSRTGLSTYRDIMNNPSGHEAIVKSFADLASDRKKISKLITTGEGFPSTNAFVSAIVKLVCAGTDAEKILSANQLVGHYSYISQCLSPDEMNKFITLLIEKGEMLTSIRQSNFDSTRAVLYDIVFKLGGIDDQEYVKYLAQGMRTIGEDSWLVELSSEGTLLELLIQLVESKVDVNLSENFFKALERHFKECFDGKTTPSRLKEKWRILPHSLTKDYMVTFVKKVWSELIQESERPAQNIISIYGDNLLEVDLTDDKKDEVVLLLFPKILERKNLIELQWVHSVLEKRRDIFEKSQSASRGVFIDMIKNILQRKESNGMETQFQKLAIAVGIELNQLKPDNSSDTTPG